MSMLPPVSRGGMVRRPEAARVGSAASGASSATGPPAARIRSSRALGLHQRVRRRQADHAAWTHAGTAIPGSSGARVGAVELPGDEEPRREEVGEEAEAGDHAVDSEGRSLVLEELHLEHVARLRPLHVDRSCEGVRRPQVGSVAVGVGALAGQLAVQAVARLERHDLAGLTCATGSMSGCQRLGRWSEKSSRQPSDPLGGRAAAATSSSVQCRRAELVHRDDRLERSVAKHRRHDLRREPAVHIEHSLERGIVVRGRGVVLDDLAPTPDLEDMGWVGRWTERSSRSDRTLRERLGDHGKRRLAGDVAAASPGSRLSPRAAR